MKWSKLSQIRFRVVRQKNKNKRTARTLLEFHIIRGSFSSRVPPSVLLKTVDRLRFRVPHQDIAAIPRVHLQIFHRHMQSLQEIRPLVPHGLILIKNRVGKGQNEAQIHSKSGHVHGERSAGLVCHVPARDLSTRDNRFFHEDFSYESHWPYSNSVHRPNHLKQLQIVGIVIIGKVHNSILPLIAWLPVRKNQVATIRWIDWLPIRKSQRVTICLIDWLAR